MVLGAIVYLVCFPLYSYVQSLVGGGVYRNGNLTFVDLKAMSDFEMNQVTGSSSDIPTRFRNLDGKRVQLVGEVWAPANAGKRLADFNLCYSIGSCCFLGPPKVQHFVKATATGEQIDFCKGRARVTGVLHVGAVRADGVLQSVYRMDVEELKPASDPVH